MPENKCLQSTYLQGRKRAYKSIDDTLNSIKSIMKYILSFYNLLMQEQDYILFFKEMLF